MSTSQKTIRMARRWLSCVLNVPIFFKDLKVIFHPQELTLQGARSHQRSVPLLGGVRPFHQKSTCLTQLILESYVVHIRSRDSPDYGTNKTLVLHRVVDPSFQVITQGSTGETISKVSKLILDTCLNTKDLDRKQVRVFSIVFGLTFERCQTSGFDWDLLKVNYKGYNVTFVSSKKVELF